VEVAVAVEAVSEEVTVSPSPSAEVDEAASVGMIEGALLRGGALLIVEPVKLLVLTDCLVIAAES